MEDGANVDINTATTAVAVIFGAETKSLLYIGVRNKYCSTCAVADHKVLSFLHIHATRIRLVPPVQWRPI